MYISGRSCGGVALYCNEKYWDVSGKARKGTGAKLNIKGLQA